jgi:four helix bundle protein
MPWNACAPEIRSSIRQGASRRGDVDFAAFLQIAVGSARELEYYLRLAKDPDLLKSRRLSAPFAEAVEVKRMLASLMQKLRD